eukprot:TRINITY_DN3710_c0_g1_i1.p1 TRINITY_DN3710_c0_g1~~TRINITY_DN3710_c0_g1_i1.p1  ORF type:complete len:199 (+),score=46.06 TRINITY_DN3710_c0_g1_i1:60-656(+)
MNILERCRDPKVGKALTWALLIGVASYIALKAKKKRKPRHDSHKKKPLPPPRKVDDRNEDSEEEVKPSKLERKPSGALEKRSEKKSSYVSPNAALKDKILKTSYEERKVSLSHGESETEEIGMKNVSLTENELLVSRGKRPNHAEEDTPQKPQYFSDLEYIQRRKRANLNKTNSNNDDVFFGILRQFSNVPKLSLIHI